MKVTIKCHNLKHQLFIGGGSQPFYQLSGKHITIADCTNCADRKPQPKKLQTK